MANDQLAKGNVIWRRWAVGLILLLSVPLALGFSTRMSTIRQMRQDEARLKQAVLTEQARQADLKSLRSYVISDSYAEHWARVEARMVKPGEVAVIPVAPNDSRSKPAVPPSRGAPASVVEEWWAVFFGETPPLP